MTINSKLELNDGTKIPIFGFGTFLLDSKEIEVSLKAALDNNYPMIDTAQFYNNEYDIGKYLNLHENKNKKIFLITKVWISNYKFYTITSIKQSLKRLHVKSIDLVLLHMPYKNNFSININAYKQLMQAREEKLVKSIGVCNFTINELRRLHKSTGEWPAIHQFAFSPANQQAKLIEFCQQNNIVTQGYGLLKPLSKGISISGELNLKEKNSLIKIGKKYEKSPQQIILRWALQQNMIIFPKSKSIGRIKSNIQLFNFAINKREMQIIKKMDKETLDISTQKLAVISNKFGTSLKTGLLYEEHSRKLYLTNKMIKFIYSKNSWILPTIKKVKIWKHNFTSE